MEQKDAMSNLGQWFSIGLRGRSNRNGLRIVHR